MTTAKRSRLPGLTSTTEILRNGKWETVPRALEANHYAYRMDFDWWVVDQFSEWYAKHSEYWTEVNRVDPDAGIRVAYNAWLRRP